MNEFMKTLALLSLSGTVCGFILTALRKLLRGKIPATFLYAAWVVVLLRFAIPVNGLIPLDRHSDTAPDSLTLYSQPSDTVAQTKTPAPVPDHSHAELDTAAGYEPPVQTTAAKAAKSIPVSSVLFVIWCCGTAGVLAWNVIAYLRFCGLLRDSLVAPGSRDAWLYEEMCPSGKPTLKRSSLISVPLTVGIIAPVIVIPDREYEYSALRHIFAHELIHFKRRDIIRKWVTMTVFAAHWFNPCVWFFRRETDLVCELSCDELLLRKMSAEEKRGYGEAILTVAEDSCAVPCRMITEFSQGKKDLRERIIQIMSFKKKSKLVIALSLVAVAVLCISALALGPKADKAPKDTQSVSVSDVDALLAAIAPNTEIHLDSGTYNITEASGYGAEDVSKYYHWNRKGTQGEYELCIDEVDGLSIIGNNAEILTVPRMANVLMFSGCDGVYLSGLTVGHTEEATHCEGGVILLDSCIDAVIENCGLYGCGTVGVSTLGSSKVAVKGTDVYHCSGAGFIFNDGADFTVDDCRIYNCGLQEQFRGAAGAFMLNNVTGVSVKNCDIYGNRLQTLINGRQCEPSFENIRVYDNNITSVFCFAGDIDFKGLSFSGNSIDGWTDKLQNGKIVIDGNEVTDAELTAMWGEQLSSEGLGTVEAEYLSIDRAGTREVHVTTADELLSAIASDTTVYIDAQIDLTEASDYGADASDYSRKPEFGGRSYAWCQTGDGYELFIGGVSNFHLVGGELVTQPRYANVLSFIGCSDITLDGVRLGHTPEQGFCRGGVLWFDGCENVILESCDLYGCGTIGIQTVGVRELHVQNTLIHDCSIGAAQLRDTETAVFLGCRVENCPEPHFSLQGCNNFSWDNRLMDPYSAFNVE